MAVRAALGDDPSRMVKREPAFEHPIVSVTIARARYARFFRRAFLTCLIGPIALVLVTQVTSTMLASLALEAWVVAWFLGIPITTLGGWYAGARASMRGDRVEVDPEALRFLDEEGIACAVPRASIRGAIHAAGELQDVELHLTSGDAIHVELDTQDAARRLVAALGFGGAARRTLVPLQRPTAFTGCGVALLAAAATLFATCAVGLAPPPVHVAAGYVAGLFFIASGVFLSRLFAERRLVIGTDGVVIEGGFGKRFVPLQSITGVASSASEIILQRSGANDIALRVDRRERGPALADRIRAALAALRSNEPGTALVARGGRSFAAWREALHKLVAGGDYRGESVSMEALAQAVESPDASPDQRIGAALAIGMAGDEGAKQRVRIAIEGIADERFRIALESAVESAEDEAAIEEALAIAEKR